MIGLAIGALSLGAGTITALSGPVASSALRGAECGAPVQRSGDRADRARVHPRGRRRAPPRLPAERNTRRQRRHRPRDTQRQPQPRPRPRQFLRRTRAPRLAPTTAPLPSATTAAAAPTTTVPPLRTLTVDVANFAAITDINDARQNCSAVGPLPGAFRGQHRRRPNSRRPSCGRGGRHQYSLSDGDCCRLTSAMTRNQVAPTAWNSRLLACTPCACKS